MLNGKAKEKFYNTHHKKLARISEIEKVFEKYATVKGKINVSDWEKKKVSLEKDNKLCEWKLKALRDEIGIEDILDI